ncbi:hypothetical protein F5X99DRAFT_383010 [Biscogniauxia marginata]|nr:hypothetical protein F5X99DRAFT_383010 [Biscogniauxia marginata]
MYDMMAADGGRPGVCRAAQVCFVCKSRKKKCDKVLPSCGLCVRKGLNCVYETRLRNEAVVALDHTSPTSPPLVLSQAILLEPTSSQANLYRQVLNLIRETGQFVDDISARYFQGIHRYLPVVSRTNFHRNLITLAAVPSAGFSTLLLSICLVTSSSGPGSRTGHAANPRPFDRRSFHLVTKSFLAQAQALFPPSIHLIQARLLLAVYDYTRGRADDAFDSIAGCARMAYTSRLHLFNQSSLQSPVFPPAVSNANSNAETDIHLEAKEAANTWWGIIICERTFFCEVTVSEQPLVTVIPDGDVLLPTEPEILEQTEFLGPNLIPRVTVSGLSSVDVGGFGRAAQAAWLLDQTLSGFKNPSLDSKLGQLEALDSTFQTFLGVLMQQSAGKVGVFCEAIAITIRALFTLHWHLPSQSPHAIHFTYPSLETWSSRSDAALDTATKMVLDVVEVHDTFDFTAPSYSSMVRAALKHIHGKTKWEDDSWLRSAEERLRTSLNQFNIYWNIDDR